jgi:endonuclease/exonuclease/phosphatase family metal-dependent hydrolase
VFETKVAILYDSERLLLREKDYVWCSETPRVADSKSWGSWGIRSVNIARFVVRDTRRTRQRDAQEHGTTGETTGRDAVTDDESGDGVEILFFNTHLDHGSERARQQQSALLAQLVDEWHHRFPTASVILTGDFNAVAGQPVHRTLLSSGLRDAMDTCKEADAQAAAVDAAAAAAKSSADVSALSAAAAAAADVYCTDVALSFHGWTGVRYLHSYVGRLILGVAFSLSSWGWSVPQQFGHSVGEWCRSLYSLLAQGPSVALLDAVPPWPWNRLHVDWILFRQGEGELSPAPQLTLGAPAPAPFSLRHSLRVLFVSLVEVRSDELMVSDHFPLVAVFELGAG